MAKVLLVAHWDWVLFNFRMPLARMLQEQGHEVSFVCPFGEYTPLLQEAGFRCLHWFLVRQSMNPFRELFSVLHLAQIYRRERPDLVHHFTIKPNIYGSLAAMLIRWQGGRLKVINTFTGLGFFFSNYGKVRFLRTSLLPLMRMVLRQRQCWNVFQNNQDLATFLHLRLISPKRAKIIAGSGVDTRQFIPDGRLNSSNQNANPIVLMAARLLWDKGVKEFVEAASLLKERGIKAEFWWAGKPDDGNPMCVPEEALQRWHQEGLIRWLGHRKDMPDLLRRADIAVLPSYHEGVPRFLLEAAATGLPIVATDIEGCRVVVRDGVNGFLVPVRDSSALAQAIERLVRDPVLRQSMGKASRQIAETEFDQQKILQQYLDLYRQVLSDSS